MLVLTFDHTDYEGPLHFHLIWSFTFFFLLVDLGAYLETRMFTAAAFLSCSAEKPELVLGC